MIDNICKAIDAKAKVKPINTNIIDCTNGNSFFNIFFKAVRICSLVRAFSAFDLIKNILVGLSIKLNDSVIVKNKNKVLKRTVKLYRLSSLIRFLSGIITTALMIVNIMSIRLRCAECPGYEYMWINYSLLAIGIFKNIAYI